MREVGDGAAGQWLSITLFDVFVYVILSSKFLTNWPFIFLETCILLPSMTFVKNELNFFLGSNMIKHSCISSFMAR